MALHWEFQVEIWEVKKEKGENEIGKLTLKVHVAPMALALAMLNKYYERISF